MSSRKHVVPTIPEPYADIKSLHATCMALKEAIEVLTQQRGSAGDSAVTWQQLQRVGVITRAQLEEALGPGRP